MIERTLKARRENTSKSQCWILDEDCHNIFAFIGGFVDAAGYLKLEGLFTSSITGNLIAATASLYSTYGVIARIFVALAFAVGAFLTSGLGMKLRVCGEWSVRSVLLVGAVLQIGGFVLAILLGMLFESSIDQDNALNTYQLILVASAMAFSMGTQCALVKDAFPNCPSTTVVTMLLVTFASQGSQTFNYFLASNNFLDLQPVSKKRPSDYLVKMKEKCADSLGKFISTARQLASFLIGGLVGAVFMSIATFYSLFIPIGLILLVLGDSYLGTKRQRAALSTSAEEIKSSSNSSTPKPDSPPVRPSHTLQLAEPEAVHASSLGDVQMLSPSEAYSPLQSGSTTGNTV